MLRAQNEPVIWSQYFNDFFFLSFPGKQLKTFWLVWGSAFTLISALFFFHFLTSTKQTFGVNQSNMKDNEILLSVHISTHFSYVTQDQLSVGLSPTLWLLKPRSCSSLWVMAPCRTFHNPELLYRLFGENVVEKNLRTCQEIWRNPSEVRAEISHLRWLMCDC